MCLRHLKINNYITAEPITLVIVANANVLILSSGVYPTKAFPLFFLQVVTFRGNNFQNCIK